MEFLQSERSPEAIGPYSQAVKVNGFIYSSGQIPLLEDGTMVENDIKKQTRQVFANLKAILEDNFCSLQSVIKINIYLVDMKDFGIVNVLMSEAFGDHKPARATVQVAGLPKNALIEMDVIAKASDCVNY